ncbi:MAG: response regulator [Syntrophales bacterium]|nr:response regulator [Syntrophales bacterium]
MSFNILIVDDSNSMRTVIRKVIAMSGFDVDNCFEATNGIEALTVLSENWVDLVISDINMPEMNGIQLLEKMSDDEMFKMIPVVMVTTEGNEERMREAFDRGARGYLRKPFLPEECRNMLYKVVGFRENGKYETDDDDAGSLDF